MTIEQLQGLTLPRRTHHNALLQLVQVESVHRLAQLEQDIISDVHHRIDAAQSTTAQLFLQPEGRRPRHIYIADHPPHIARAALRCLQAHRQGIGNRRRHRLTGHSRNRHIVQQADFAGDAGDAQAICAIGREADLNEVIIQLQILTQIGAWGRISRQFHQAFAGLRQAQLGFGAEHAPRLNAAQLGFLDFEITRQHSPYLCQRHLDAGAGIGCPADNLHGLRPSIDRAHPQLVGIGVLHRLEDFGHHHVAELARDGLDSIHFQPGHGDLVRQFLGR